MLTQLFMDGPASDVGYVNIRDATDGILKSARGHCEYLWILYQHHADTQFRAELRDNFDARYWEMYLTMTLIFTGYEVTCPKPGPDVGIVHEGKRIWFEATTPTRGALDNPDRVPEPHEGLFEDVPEDRMILRHLTSISAKCGEQYQSWLKAGIVTKEDAYVVALNTHKLGFHDPNADPPQILQAAYNVGKPVFEIDSQTLTLIRKEYKHRSTIGRTQPDASKADAERRREPIETGVFQNQNNAFLSGLLFSHVDVANRVGEMGSDFQLATNPYASAPLPDGLRLRGTRYHGRESDGGLAVQKHQVQS